MEKNYTNEELMMKRKDVVYNIKTQKFSCNMHNEDFADYIDEINYAYSLDDDVIHNEFVGNIEIAEIW